MQKSFILVLCDSGFFSILRVCIWGSLFSFNPKNGSTRTRILTYVRVYVLMNNNYQSRNQSTPFFKIGKDTIKYSSNYKYLGITLTENGSNTLAITTLANQTSKALFALMRGASKLSFPKRSLLCYLFDTLIKPVAEYGSEIWGHAHAEEASYCGPPTDMYGTSRETHRPVQTKLAIRTQRDNREAKNLQTNQKRIQKRELSRTTTTYESTRRKTKNKHTCP